ncbi:MAG: type II secretion system F family protein [Acidimicrobiales bacterium]
MVLLASLSASGFMVGASRMVMTPRRRLATRLRPYAALSRSRLGTGYADVSVVALAQSQDASVVRRVFGPLVNRAAESFGAVIDTTDDVTLARRLRQAGYGETRPEQYRMRQLAFTVGGVALGLFLGLTILGTPLGTLLLGVLFGFPAATVQRNRVERAIVSRRARMRTEVYTVAQLIAVHIRTGHGPVDAVRMVCVLGRGPVIGELRECLAWISSGTAPQRAYEKLAEATPEPAAGRLYRLLSASARSGGDIGSALLAISDDLRSERREEIARAAVKRRTAMLVPLLLFIAPVMVLFVGAALPSLVLGPGR